MRLTPRKAAQQLGKFWGTPDRIDIGTAPRDWKRFWRKPPVRFITAHRGGHTITLRPGRGPEQQRIPLSAWSRSYSSPEDRPARTGRSKR